MEYPRGDPCSRGKGRKGGRAYIKAGIFEADWGVGEPSDRLYQVGGAWYELDRRSERGATCAYLIKYDRLFNLVAIPGLMYGVDPKTGERLVLWKNFDILSKSFPVIREEVDWADPLFDPFFRPPGPGEKITEAREVFTGREVVDLSSLGIKRPQWPSRLVTEVIGVGEQ